MRATRFAWDLTLTMDIIEELLDGEEAAAADTIASVEVREDPGDGAPDNGADEHAEEGRCANHDLLPNTFTYQEHTSESLQSAVWLATGAIHQAHALRT